MKKFFRNQKGQGIMEYVIISALVGIVTITAVKSFGATINKHISDMRTKINENINISLKKK